MKNTIKHTTPLGTPTPAANAAERATRIHRLMNSGVSQALATKVIDRDFSELRAASSIVENKTNNVWF